MSVLGSKLFFVLLGFSSWMETTVNSLWRPYKSCLCKIIFAFISQRIWFKPTTL